MNRCTGLYHFWTAPQLNRANPKQELYIKNATLLYFEHNFKLKTMGSRGIDVPTYMFFGSPSTKSYNPQTETTH